MKAYYLNKTKASWNRLYAVFVFIGLFAIQIIVFYILYLNPWMKSNLFTPLAVIYAKLSGLFLNIMGEHIVVSSDLISSAKFSLQVKRGCDAMEPMVVFIAGVIAFPASYKDKLKGLGVGLSIIFFLNILRIISLYYTGIFFPAFFEMMHVEVWQVLFIIIAITFWFKWLQWLMAKRS